MLNVMHYLLKAKKEVSGEEIAGALNISRTAVWKQINQMKKMGFIIHATHKAGYELIGFPKERIIPGLVEFYYGKLPPFEIISLESVDSTNNYAKKLIVDHSKTNSFILTSDEQTLGRGRMSRKWESEKGKDLTFTFNYCLDQDVNEYYKFTIIAAMAVFYSIKSVQVEENYELKIKWPNDIYLNKKKICGILSEMITEGLRIKNMLIGIGINVNSDPAVERAISMKQAFGKETDRNSLLALIISNLDKYLNLYTSRNFEAVFQLWKSNLGWIGDEIRIDTGKEKISGIFKDIYPDGAIVIVANGIERVFYSGDLLT